MQQPLVKKANVPGVNAFHYVLADVEPEPLVDTSAQDAIDRAKDTVPCAYCRRLTPPEIQATPPWNWPGRGLVTNCVTCAGGPDGEDIPNPPCGSRVGTIIRIDIIPKLPWWKRVGNFFAGTQD